MKRKMHLFVAGMIVAAAAVFVGSTTTEAFCVYNYTKDITIKVIEDVWSSGNFEARLSPGQSACCHWTEMGCNKYLNANKTGKRTDEIQFDVRDDATGRSICFKFIIRAGGALTVEGEKGNYACKRWFDGMQE